MLAQEREQAEPAGSMATQRGHGVLQDRIAATEKPNREAISRTNAP
jgi:hypothetical protein